MFHMPRTSVLEEWGSAARDVKMLVQTVEKCPQKKKNQEKCEDKRKRTSCRGSKSSDNLIEFVRAERVEIEALFFSRLKAKYI